MPRQPNLPFGPHSRNGHEDELSRLRRIKRDADKTIDYLLKRIKMRKKITRRLAEKILKLRAMFKRFKQPPNDYAVFVRPHPNGQPDEVDVLTREQAMKKVLLVPWLKAEELKCGWEVLLNANGNVVLEVTKDYWHWGESAIFREKLSDDVALVVKGDNSGQVSQCYLGPELKEVQLKEGDLLLNCNGLLVKALPKTEQKELFKDVEEISEYNWSRVGGLSRALKQIHRALLPFKKPDVYKNKFKGKRLNRGMILHGPSGCGKTLVAKCIAADLARSRGIKCYFLPFVGARLLNKYVGQTEENIRGVFARAKEKAADGSLVLVFIDEMDSLFLNRNASTMEHMPWMTGQVGQFNDILDGTEALGNIFVIGASNQKHLIDSAILRPGRLGIDVRIHRPKSEKDVAEILRIYIAPDLPFAKKYLEQDEYEYTDYFDGGKKKKVKLDKDPEKVREFFVDRVVKRLFYEGEEFQIRLEDEKNGVIKINNKFSILMERGKEEKYLKDLLSGAALASIVDTTIEIAFARYDKLAEELREKLTEQGMDLAKIKEEVDKLDLNIMTEGDFYKAVREEVRRLKFSFPRPEKEGNIGFRPPDKHDDEIVDESDDNANEPDDKPGDEPDDEPESKSDDKPR